MSDALESFVRKTCAELGHDRTRMMDVVRAVQTQFGCVSNAAMNLIARELKTHRVEVESVVSFYAFFSQRQKGKVIIRVCDDVIDRMAGAELVAKAFSEELGIGFGQTSADGKFSLEWTPCIGMCDQAPAALINDVVVTELTGDRAREIVRELRNHMDPRKLVRRHGDGNNGHELVNAMVNNNIRKRGPVIFSPTNRGEAIRKALAMSPAEVIRAVKTARLRGRGGAGFPCGMKWEFTRAAPGDRKFVLCNADEGEPGTFKDRVILTELPDRVFAGMTIAGYAIGAETGILYLRGEYAYLRAFLEDTLAKRRADGLLGKNVCGKPGFDFDIRIQMGAGAYVCGEETALISSCEGQRGDPKNRPPFPAQKGYLGCPTVVNNVETLCCVTKILEEGPATFCEYGTQGSSGTKLLSISGDCTRPGVYEVPFGLTVTEMLKMAGGEDAIAVQMGGASGQMVPPKDFGRKICYDDLATGGSVMIFGPGRDLLKVASRFLEFFIEESCGTCTPCRAGNVLLKERLDRIIAGKGEPADLPYLEELGETIKATSRCGLGQTSPNPVLTTLKNFRPLYEALVKERPVGLRPEFDLQAAVSAAEAIVGRKSVHVEA
ncbi:MAG: NAD(P)H-dependent oxidoreductase subunit E [Phycisphaerae bacterium]|nr:NAD(P)H-dependent oxidoreductase subunit E [Phycisphaerae bacterium]